MDKISKWKEYGKSSPEGQIKKKINIPTWTKKKGLLTAPVESEHRKKEQLY